MKYILFWSGSSGPVPKTPEPAPDTGNSVIGNNQPAARRRCFAPGFLQKNIFIIVNSLLVTAGSGFSEINIPFCSLPFVTMELPG
jgi:hypothetical protein